MRSGFAVLMLIASTAMANHVINVNMVAASQTLPTELAYDGRVGGVGGISIDNVDASQIVAVNGIAVHESLSISLAGLLAHAKRDGVVLSGWGWRSHQRQHELRRINGCPDGWVHRPGEKLSDFSSAGTCRVPTARPGASLHETGLAIDFTCNGRPIAGTRCFSWLRQNAATYGLYNLPSEPWHWSVNGN